MDTMSRYQYGGLKRRGPDDLVQDLLNVSLSPPKKFRVSDAGVTVTSGLGSNLDFTNASEMQGSTSPGIMTLPIPEPSRMISPPRPAPEEEKALVLYRPVTPPLFPGGPPAGTVDFPYKVNSAMLPTPQGTDSELTSHQLDCQSACSNDTDALSGHGLFQALDLSGGPVSTIGQRRLNRVSSCSSLPRFFLDEDQLMVEEIDKSAELAVIPWVPMTPVVFPPQIRPIIEEVDDDNAGMADADPMVDDDSMEVMNEDNVVVSEASMTPTTGQFGGQVPSFSASPWQAEILQPSFPTAMWSH